jgi:allantoicase
MSDSAAAVPGFTELPDLASRALGGSVVFANDELFAAKESLITPTDPVHAAGDFGHKGKVYDGWETRRRREPGHDHAIVRLGVPGIVHGVVVDTAYFRGNYPPQVSVEATWAEGYPSPAELAGRPWETLVGRADARGDTANRYAVSDRRCWTHVRLSIYPDGGVARFRVHGQVLPDPAFLTGTIDLAAMENGGQLIGCSGAFYSSPSNLIMPGRARVMSDGWENARRRGPGNDYAIFRLAAAGQLRHVEIDTSYFVGNAPGWVRLSAADDRSPGHAAHAPPARSGEYYSETPTGQGLTGEIPAGEIPAGAAPIGAVLSGATTGLSWWEVLPETRVQPDTRHRFRVETQCAATHIRLDIVPDGGLARLRVYGEVTAEALAELTRRWRDALPAPRRGAAEPQG